MTDINAAVNAAIQASIVTAFNTVPDAVNLLVKAALEGKVDDAGRPASYGGKPYLDYIVGDTIRDATRDAVRQAVKERAEEVAKSVAAKVSVETLVSGLAEKIIGVVTDDWKVSVSFKDENDSRYR